MKKFDKIKRELKTNWGLQLFRNGKSRYVVEGKWYFRRYNTLKEIKDQLDENN